MTRYLIGVHETLGACWEKQPKLTGSASRLSWALLILQILGWHNINEYQLCRRRGTVSTGDLMLPIAAVYSILYGMSTPVHEFNQV
jgi:hypothetical protein